MITTRCFGKFHGSISGLRFGCQLERPLGTEGESDGYLITGGSGYIGSRLTDLLVQRGDDEVVNLDIRPPAVPARARSSSTWTSATAAWAP